MKKFLISKYVEILIETSININNPKIKLFNELDFGAIDKIGFIDVY